MAASEQGLHQYYAATLTRLHRISPRAAMDRGNCEPAAKGDGPPNGLPSGDGLTIRAYAALVAAIHMNTNAGHSPSSSAVRHLATAGRTGRQLRPEASAVCLERTP